MSILYVPLFRGNLSFMTFVVLTLVGLENKEIGKLENEGMLNPRCQASPRWRMCRACGAPPAWAAASGTASGAVPPGPGGARESGFETY